MAEGIEFGIVGKITYYTMVVYLLFIVGLIIVCRHRYKSHQERKRKKSNERSHPGAEKSDECKEMGLFQSKKKDGYSVDGYGNLNKRNVAKYTRHDGDRPSTSDKTDNRPTSNGENSTSVGKGHKIKRKSNKEDVNLPCNNDNIDKRKISSNDPSKVVLEEKLETETRPDNQKFEQEIANYNVTSASQNQLKSTTEQPDTSILPENTGVNHSDESKEELSLQSEGSFVKRDELSCFADEISTEIVQVACSEIDKKVQKSKSRKLRENSGAISNLAESIISTSLQDSLTVVGNQKTLNTFANEIAAKIISDMLTNEGLLSTLKKALRQKKDLSVKMKTNAEKTSSTYCKSIVENVYKEACSRTRSIGNLSENLSTVILESAIDSSVKNNHSVKLPGSSNTEEAGGESAQQKMINAYSDQFAENILDNALADASSKTSATKIKNERILPTVELSASEDTASGSDFNVCKFSPPTNKGAEKRNLSQTDGDDESSFSDSDTEKEAKTPVVLRNKSLLKIKLHTDRPLSSYAEQLAGFLADDDDSLNLFESDDEFDAVLDKMEEKFKGHEKLNMKIQKRRKHSESRLGTLGSPSHDREQRGRLASTQSNCSYASSTDTDDVLRGTTPDDQLLSPGFSKFQMKTTVVIDTGSGVIKAGMAGEIAPRCELPSVIGVPRRFSQDISKMDRGYYVGHEAIFRAGMLQLDHPIKQEVTNWSDVQSLIEYVSEVELGVSLTDHPVLLTETGLTSKKQREKFTEVMFERNRVPAFYLANQGPLSLYSMGLMSGLCLNSGFDTTQVIPVYDGHPLPYCSRRLDIGGHQISNYLGRLLLSGKGLAFSSSSEKFLLDDMKKSLGYVAEDPKMEQERYRKFSDQVERVFTLPDGQEIIVDVERFGCSEILFDPEIIGLEQKPMQSLLLDSIASANSSLQPTLMSHVIVSGGTSLLPGFTQRLRKELETLTDHTADVRLTSASSPTTAAWIGGSVISSRSTFSQQCITADEYAEIGAAAVHMKCF